MSSGHLFCANRNGMETKGMLLTEYDEKTAMELFKEEGRAEGIQGIVGIYQELGGSVIDAVEKVASTFGYDEGKSRAMVQKYWK